MLETYFDSPKMLAHLRSGPSGPYLDGFAAWLERCGYDPSVAVRYLRSAAHIGHFTLDQGGTLADVDLAAFSGHLRTCRCPRPKGGRRNHHTVYGARRYREYLAAIGVGQMERISELIDRKRQILLGYRERLAGLNGVALNPEPLGTIIGAWMPSAVFDPATGVTQEKLKSTFGKEMIDARVFFEALSKLPMFENCPDNRQAWDIPGRAINLPSYHDMTSDDQDRVVDVIGECLRR